jgi:hypothetical protein
LRAIRWFSQPGRARPARGPSWISLTSGLLGLSLLAIACAPQAPAPVLFAVHDLNLRVLSPKVRGFVQPQSWFADLRSVWMSK